MTKFQLITPPDTCTQHGPPPRVSVLMPVYNAQRYLSEALDSVLAQTYDDFELIAVDDGSTDRSPRILQGYAKRDGRLRVIRRPNRGIVAALNDGLAQSRGELIARMDGDDTCSPARLEKQIALLDGRPDVVAVGTWATLTDPYGSPTGEQRPAIDHAAIDATLMQGDGSSIIHATTVIRRGALTAVGGWRAEYNWVEDLDLFLRLAEVGKLANVAEDLYRYRRHMDCVCFNRYQQMCQTIEHVMAEAHGRRGISEPFDTSFLDRRLPRPTSTATYYRNWACHAIEAGNARIARRHALAAIGKDPLSLASWRVMYWAMTA